MGDWRGALVVVCGLALAACGTDRQCSSPWCESCDCGNILECMDACDAPEDACLQACAAEESIETQMAFNALMNCLGIECYELDQCPVDPKVECPDEYDPCFPPID